MNKIILPLACGLLAVGCTQVRGFQYAEDGNLTVAEARQAAIVAQAEADALWEIAGEHERTANHLAGQAEGIARTVGAPELVSGLIGAAAGLFVPAPRLRKKNAEAPATQP